MASNSDEAKGCVIQAAQTLQNTPSASPGGTPLKIPKHVRSIAKHHVGSFNYLVREGLALAVRDILPMTVLVPTAGRCVRFWPSQSN